MIKKLSFLAILILCWGCATTWKSVPTELYIDDKLRFTAAAPAGWMYFPGNPLTVSKDGIQLAAITVEKLKFNKDLPYTKKKFLENMLLLELADVDIDNFRSNSNNLHFEVLENIIVQLDNKDAYRFAFQYQTMNGLKKKGIVYGTVHNGLLYRITYSAAEQHYYDLYEKQFVDFIKSFKFYQK